MSAPGEANPMMIPAAAGAGVPPGPMPPEHHPGLMQYLGQGLDMATVKLDKLDAAARLLSATRAEMDSLAKMADLVTHEDVVRGASKLVAAGLSAGAVAGLLADMPPDGPALAGWIAEQDQQVHQREAQLAQAHALARHQTALAGVRTLMGHSMAPPEAPAAAMPAAGNPMMPAAGGPADAD